MCFRHALPIFFITFQNSLKTRQKITTIRQKLAKNTRRNSSKIASQAGTGPVPAEPCPGRTGPGLVGPGRAVRERGTEPGWSRASTVGPWQGRAEPGYPGPCRAGPGPSRTGPSRAGRGEAEPSRSGARPGQAGSGRDRAKSGVKYEPY